MKKKSLVVGLLVIILAFCLAGCNSSHNITTEVSGKGTVTVDKTTVTRDDSALVKVEAQDGYYLRELTANGKYISVKNGEYTLKNVEADTVIKATFSRVGNYTEEQLEPHTIALTFFDKAATEYGITWHNKLGGQPIVQIMKADGQTKENADFTKADVVTAQSTEDGTEYKNFANLFGLEFDTEYLYRVGDSVTDVFSEVFSFKTRKENVEAFTFIHTSDTQDDYNFGSLYKLALDDAFKNYKDAVFSINTGDIVQKGGSASMWKKMLGFVAPYVAEKPFVPVAGNHDYWQDYLYGKTSVTYNHFFMDLPEQDTTNGMFYSFEYGDALFIVLNTGDTEITRDRLTDGQLDWLKKELKETDKTWKIISMHNPLYSPGKYGSSTDKNAVARGLREQLNELLSDREVDLVLTGHDHVYSRTFPISEDGKAITDTKKETADFNGTKVEYMVSPKGPIHLASGCAGNQGRWPNGDLAEADANMFEEMEDSSEHVTYSAITIDGNRLTVNHYMVNLETEESKLAYSWGIQK